MTFYSKVVSGLLTLSIALNGYLLLPNTIAQPQKATQKSHSATPLAFSQTSPTQAAQHAFENGDYEHAVTLYLALEDSHPLAAEALYTNWLSTLERWLLNDELITSEQFLNAFLVRRPYDLKMLYQDAQRLLRQGEIHNAIISLYALHALADEPLKAKLSNQLMQLTNDQLNELTAQQAWQKMVTQTLVWLDYDNEKPRYLLALASAYYQLDDLLSAQNTLDRLPTEHSMQQEVEQLQTLIDNKNAGIDLISLQKQGAHYLVEATLNQYTNATLMLDTGASFTVLPRTVFEQLVTAPQPLGNLMVNTANGKVTAQRYRVESITIGQQQLNNFDILIIDNHTGYGLLGMNFLNHFKFNINQQTDQLELAP